MATRAYVVGLASLVPLVITMSGLALAQMVPPPKNAVVPPTGSILQGTPCQGPSNTGEALGCVGAVMSQSIDATRGAGAVAATKASDAMTNFSANNHVLEAFGKTVDTATNGAKVWGAYERGGTDAATETIGQIIIEKGVDWGVDSFIGWAAAAASVAEAPVAGAYAGGKFIGNIANTFIRPCSDATGQSLTTQDCLTDNVWVPLLADHYYNAGQELAKWKREFDAMSQSNDSAAVAAYAEPSIDTQDTPQIAFTPPMFTPPSLPALLPPTGTRVAAPPIPPRSAPLSNPVPPGWVACDCPEKHAHLGGIRVNGVLYHAPGPRCDAK